MQDIFLNRQNLNLSSMGLQLENETKVVHFLYFLLQIINLWPLKNLNGKNDKFWIYNFNLVVALGFIGA